MTWDGKLSKEQELAAHQRAAKWQLLAGLFGWAWLIAGPAALIFAGAALFGWSSWWNVLYAFAISAVAKWLARGFEDHRKRVYFEARCVAGGMSPEQASQLWMASHMK